MIAAQYLPWTGPSVEKYRVPQHSEEYRAIEKLFNKNKMRLDFLIHHRNENRYMQFLVRQQFLCRLHPSSTFYVVKHFVDVDESDVDIALSCNLDSRRCSVENRFVSDLARVRNARVVFVILTVTETPWNDFTPTRDSDYYIEYIAYLED